jgi:hypothetical protein
MEIQTDLKMGTINKYEASLLDTNPNSSDVKQSFPPPIQEKMLSEFGHMIGFNNDAGLKKKKTNVLD